MMCGKIKDSNYPPEDWKKMQHTHEIHDRSEINIHYWENQHTQEGHGYKFKDLENP